MSFGSGFGAGSSAGFGGGSSFGAPRGTAFGAAAPAFGAGAGAGANPFGTRAQHAQAASERSSSGGSSNSSTIRINSSIFRSHSSTIQKPQQARSNSGSDSRTPPPPQQHGLRATARSSLRLCSLPLSPVRTPSHHALSVPRPLSCRRCCSEPLWCGSRVRLIRRTFHPFRGPCSERHVWRPCCRDLVW